MPTRRTLAHARLRRRLVRALAPLALMLATKRAEAHGPLPSHEDNLVFVGPSLAYAPGSGQRSGFLVGVDSTLTVGGLWASLGTRLRLGDRMNVYPYGEIGLWLLVNFGVGYSRGLGAHIPPHNWHWFVGLPIPLDFAIKTDDTWILLAEPYYRPTMDSNGDHPTLHELGVLVKWGRVVGSSARKSKRPAPRREPPLPSSRKRR